MLFIMKVTSEVVDMRELSMLCMDWVSGVPREARVTKFLFPAPDTNTAFVPSDTWDKTLTKRSKADPEARNNVRPAYANLVKMVDESPSITLKTLCVALNSASGGNVFTVRCDKHEAPDGSITYPGVEA